jgi:SpoVK/Ycf46/Vps4 family AAA+-type ATPase
LVAEKVITYLQGLGDYDDMLHIVLTAPPGYGKTMISYLLSEIFFKLGIIKKQENTKTSNESQSKTNETDKLEEPDSAEKNIMSLLGGQMSGQVNSGGRSAVDNKEKKYKHPITNEEIDFPFILARRSDLIGKYVGHTAPKVEDMVKKSLGGVLVIDEAYSLGRDDTYSDEAINALNQMLSEYSGQFICIIAGYEKELKKNFFTNPGLERRFRLKIKLEQYTPKELTQIFIKMVNDSSWKVSFNIKWMEEFIEENKDSFKFAGGDLLNLLQCCKDSHSKRVLGKHPKTKKGINKDDIVEGFKIYKDHKNNNNKNSKLPHMYI